MKIVLSGDWHGNLAHARRVIDAAHAAKSERIIQVGDFGWFPHIQDGYHDTYPGKVNDYAVEHGVRVEWLDGNHENFDDLEQRRFGEDGQGFRYYERPDGDTGKLLTNVAYIPRGTVFALGYGLSALAFGGAFSVDRLYRKLGFSWWQQELPTGAEVDAALAKAQPVDVMLTHDAPALPEGLNNKWKEDPASVNNRAGIYALMEAYTPKLLVHGHYHLPYTITIPHGNHQTQVIGLGGDSMGGADTKNCVLFNSETGLTESLQWPIE